MNKAFRMAYTSSADFVFNGIMACVMACGRIRLSSRKLYEIITLIWLIGILNDVKLTAKDGDVSTEDFGYLSNKVWINFQRPKFITNTPAKGFFGLRLTRYSNSTSTFQLKRLAESGDINPNPGPEKCASCSRTVAKNHRSLRCSSCDCLMHIKCGNVRPYQFLQIIATTLTSWKCPGCDLFSELPFFKLDNIELASEFENDGNNVLEGSNITVSEVHASKRYPWRVARPFEQCPEQCPDCRKNYIQKRDLDVSS